MESHYPTGQMLIVTPTDQTCRTCLNNVDVVGLNIFNCYIEGKMISNILKTHISLQVEKNDMLPQNMCSRCVANLVEIMNFVKKCLNSNIILQSMLQFKDVKVNVEDTCVTTCDFVRNQILNDHTYENQEKNEDNASDNSISEQTHEFEIPSEIIKCEVNVLKTEISDVGLDEMLRDDEECNMLKQEIVTEHTNEYDNIAEMSTNEDTTNSETSKTRKIVTPGKKSKKYKMLSHSTKSRCGYCKLTFPTSEILQHKQTVHAMAMIHTCDYCPKKFKRKCHKNVHMRTHTRDKPYECNDCGRKFSAPGSLKRHKMLHTGEKPNMCEHCGKRYIQLGDLQHHLSVHLYDKFTCEFCGKMYENVRCLKKHMKEVHVNKGKEAKFEYPIRCDELDSLKSLRLACGKSRHLCDHCGKRFKTKGALETHQRIHTGEKPYRCDICQKAFSQITALHGHRRTHTGERPYVCKICSRKFTMIGHLGTHMKTHTGEKPYKCPFCYKAFASKKNMIVHSRIHTGERPYACTKCDKRFYHSSAVKKHLKSHKDADEGSVNG